MARGIIQANTHLNFVQRLLRPREFPVINNPDGSYSTHRMAWSTDDHGPFVYPTIVYDDATKSVKQLGDQEAARHALKTGEMIRMPSDEDADWFSWHGYKLGSDIEQQAPSGALVPGPNQLTPAQSRGGLILNPPPVPSRGIGGLSR